VVVLGIDPGTAIVGYSVVSGTKNKPKIEDFGVIRCHGDLENRLLEIAQDLDKVIQQFKPDISVVEDLFFFKNQKTVISVAQARGVILYILHKNQIPIISLTPLQIKQALTGYGRASKQQVQRVIKTIFELENLPKPDDAADALANAWCGL
jgi:crossover junction endodeoxyribonuclease RuvC